MELLRCLLIGLSACALGVVIDLIRYNFSQSFGSSSYTRHGIFMLLIVVYLFRNQIHELRKKNRESRIYIKELSEAIAKVVDMKDKYTNGHSSRVAKIYGDAGQGTRIRRGNGGEVLQHRAAA